MGSRVARRDGDGTRGGFVWEDGKLHLCDSFEITTEWEGDDSYHQTITAVLRSSRPTRSGRSPAGCSTSSRCATGAPIPDGDMLVTRICEGMTEWTLDDGRVGYGLSEYLDQIIDGAPVGLAE